MEGSIDGDFCFGGCTGTATLISGPKAPVTNASDEIAVWESINSSQSLDAYQSYLDQYPSGRFVAIARVRIRALSKASNASQDSPNRPSITQSTSSDICPSCNCSDLVAKLSIGVESLSAAQEQFYRQKCH